ncbi:MAG: hypothetical protein LBV33_05430 [Lachnospiraceae bacterium]|nr:hypothetical protein [Lachnospiraceae bacterium]
MGMERLLEIRESCETFMQELLEQRLAEAEHNFRRQQLIWQQVFWDKLDELLEHRDETTENVVISLLHSSSVSGSNAFHIALYDDEIYIEPDPPCVYYVPEFLFVEIEEDMEQIRNHIAFDYISLTDSEMQEMKRQYLQMVYESAEDFFRLMLPDSKEEGLTVYFGRYMKQVRSIGEI